MTRITPETRARAGALRRTMTEAEKTVWRGLRDLNRAFGFHFRRQAPIGAYIADFADYSARLVIEIDGGHHDETRDRPRTDWLNTQGFHVLRFWNSDVTQNLDGVLARILETRQERELT
jgi:very-short-patch-repair endonuclease